jgi:hypothetical protein
VVIIISPHGNAVRGTPYCNLPPHAGKGTGVELTSSVLILRIYTELKLGYLSLHKNLEWTLIYGILKGLDFVPFEVLLT